MLYLDQALLTRWNNLDMSATITGGLWRDEVPESPPTTMPYCTFTDVSDAKSGQSTTSRYQTALLQFDTYNVTNLLCGQNCESVEQCFINANLAQTNPLVIVGQGTDFIVSCFPTAPYTTRNIGKDSTTGDTVWQGSQTFQIQYRRAVNIQPS